MSTPSFFVGAADSDVLEHEYIKYLRAAMLEVAASKSSRAAEDDDTTTNTPTTSSSYNKSGYPAPSASVVENIINGVVVDPILVPQAGGPNVLMQSVLPQAREVARRRARLAKMTVVVEAAKAKILVSSSSTSTAVVAEKEAGEEGSAASGAAGVADNDDKKTTSIAESLSLQVYMKDIEDFMTKEKEEVDVEARAVMVMYKRHVAHLQSLLQEK